MLFRNIQYICKLRTSTHVSRNEHILTGFKYCIRIRYNTTIFATIFFFWAIIIQGRHFCLRYVPEYWWLTYKNINWSFGYMVFDKSIVRAVQDLWWYTAWPEGTKGYISVPLYITCFDVTHCMTIWLKYSNIEISLRFIPTSKTAYAQIMDSDQIGDKPLSEPMVT